MSKRAEGALIGLALGDALGMPTQMLDRARVTELYGVLDRFHPGPADNPISPGQVAGTVTDDTEQSVILARLLLDGGGAVDTHAFATALAEWHADMEARGSLDLLGPSTLRAIRAFQDGVPATETGRWGDTNGAAMRVAPLGIAHRPLPLRTFVARVAEVNALTHNTRIANAGAAAIGAAVSAGIDGAAVEDALGIAVEAADLGAAHVGQVSWVRSASIAPKKRSKHSGSVPRRLMLSTMAAITGWSAVPRRRDSKNVDRNAASRSSGVPSRGTEASSASTLSGSSTMSSARRHSA